MDQERLHFLLQRYFDQLLSAQERSELEQMFLEFARAREEFWEMARWHALIRQWGQAEWGRRDAVTRVPAIRPAIVSFQEERELAPRVEWSWKPLAWAAAAMILLTVGSRLVLTPHVETTQSEDLENNIAAITHAAGVVWADDNPARQTGESLAAGWLRIKSGALQVEFSRGAHVVLEGPAEFRLDSDNEGFLKSGKLRARVPESAHGFKIRASEFSVVDLGTEFGCIVPLIGSPEVHVFTGGIELHSPEVQSGMRQLRENEAMRFEKGKAQSITADRIGFLSEEGLAQRENPKPPDRVDVWRAATRKWSENPATIVYFDFERESEWERTLANRAVQAPPGSDASIIGCDWADGRWPNKSALEFKRTDDRMRMTVPGSFQSLTMFAWVRVDSLRQVQQSLLMGESFQPGEVHWYLYRDGSLGFGVRIASTGGELKAWHDYRTAPVLEPEMFGTWAFVAVVFDAATGTVTHYFNGKPVGSAQPGIHLPLRLDTFEIGNWGVPPDSPRLREDPTHNHIRNFSGRIDEFAILAAPLNDRAIQRLYEEGSSAAPASP